MSTAPAIGAHHRYIAAELTTGWCVWDLAVGQKVRDADDQAGAEKAAGLLNTGGHR